MPERIRVSRRLLEDTVAGALGKGARVRVTGGKQGVGSTGTIFWIGDDKFNPGQKRFGVRADDGETLWISDAHVEELSGSAAELPPPPEPPRKGDRVQWRNRGDEGEGTVFWVGASKSGPGHRVGVRLDDQEEPLWLDARQITVIDAPPKATSALPDGGGRRAPSLGDDDEPAPLYADGAQPAGMPTWDDEAPVDERFAPSDEEPPFDPGPSWS